MRAARSDTNARKAHTGERIVIQSTRREKDDGDHTRRETLFHDATQGRAPPPDFAKSHHRSRPTSTVPELELQAKPRVRSGSA